MARNSDRTTRCCLIEPTVPRPKDECVTNNATMEEKSSGDEAPAAIRVAPVDAGEHCGERGDETLDRSFHNHLPIILQTWPTYQRCHLGY